jgi:hypothetical protein
MPDGGSAIPDVFGGPNGTLAFPFASPVSVTIPPSGWLVVQLTLQANTNQGLAHAILDAQKFTGVADGRASSSGTGCTDGKSSSTSLILTSGTYAPGAAHSIHGSNLGASANVMTVIGASDASYLGIGLPYPLPGTSCTAFASFDLVMPQVADATGAILPQSASSFLSVPPAPELGGALLFEQHVSLVPGANAYGVVTSDKRTITLGGYVAPTNGVWYAANGDSATAPAATLADALGFAARLRVN